MPPIIDAAIGTFFVFMLFSIAVTALTEVVLSFFDKRADFLRLGLGELLSDSQKENMENFLRKLGKYSSKSGAWLATWTLGIPLLGLGAEFSWLGFILTAILILVVLVTFEWPAWREWITDTWVEVKETIAVKSPTLKLAPERTAPASLSVQVSASERLAAEKAAVVKMAASRAVVLKAANGNLTEAKALAVRAAAVKAAAMKSAAIRAITTGSGPAENAPQAGFWSTPTTSSAAPTSPVISVGTIFKHPLIFSLSKGDTDPSYISSSSFAKALIDLLVPAVGSDGKITNSPDIETIKAAIMQVSNENLKQSLAALLRSADNSVDKFKISLEEWFNSGMERVTGWYKRYAQTWLIALAFMLAVACNVDAIRIIQTLSNNPNLAKSVAAQAENYVKTNESLVGEADLEAVFRRKREHLTKAEKELDAINQPLTEAKKKFDQAKDDAAKKVEEANLAKAIASIDLNKKEAAEAALKKAQLEISMPLSTEALDTLRKQKEENIENAKTALKEAKKENDEEKVKMAEKKLDEAIGWDAALDQLNNDLKALSATGIPMGWDQKTHRLFGILKSEEDKEAAEKKAKEDKKVIANNAKTAFGRLKNGLHSWTSPIVEWISQPVTWLSYNVYRPNKWHWGVLFPALCGWALTAIAASLGAPFWFDLLQRIMNLRANGRSPDEKALGTKKPAPAAEKPQPSLPAVPC